MPINSVLWVQPITQSENRYCGLKWWVKEAVVQRYSVKVSQNSLEKTCGCQNLLFNKVAGLQPVMRLRHSCFPVYFEKFLNNTYFEEHVRTATSGDKCSNIINNLVIDFIFCLGLSICALNYYVTAQPFPQY